MKRYFNPKCMNGEETFAVSNRNELIPCCLVDNEGLKSYPSEYLINIKLVSNISENESIDDILCKKEWTDFTEVIQTAKTIQNVKNVPYVCRISCMSNTEIRKENWQD